MTNFKLKIFKRDCRYLYALCLVLGFCIQISSSESIQKSVASSENGSSTTNSSLSGTLEASTTKPMSTTKFVPHRFTSSNNITILHEVHDNGESPMEDEVDLPSLVSLKSKKKKPIVPLEKTIVNTLEKPKPLQEFELHPLAFDFNLGDLEDLAHGTIRKGDLSAEEKHLLSNDYNEGLTYTDDVSDIEIPDAEAVGLDISIVSTEPTNSGQTIILPLGAMDEHVNITKNSSISTILTLPPITLPSTVTVGPHILKIFKGKHAKKQELMKKNDFEKRVGNPVNSILDIAAANYQSNSSSGLHGTGNLFQILTNLYDHFYWQTENIKKKVSTACGLEMQIYLAALQENYDWAQKAYDASGRYRGQILFGNDKWLGQKNFCYDMQQQQLPAERHRFEFAFYAALIEIHLWIPHQMSIQLQLGECLPKSCTVSDVERIIEMDPHALMLQTLSTINSTHNSVVHVLSMRAVPGLYSHWRDMGFQVFLSVILTMLVIVLLASYYQAKLNGRKCSVGGVPAISAKIDANMSSVHNLGNGHGSFNGKAFEVYQMRTLSETNNNTTTSSNHNSNVPGMTAAERIKDTPKSVPSSPSLDLTSRKDILNGNCNVNCNGCNHGSCTKKNSMRNNGDVPNIVSDIEKPHLVELDNGSSFGANGHFEAKKQLALHEQILLCFAFQKSAGAILDIDHQKDNQTSCLHGLRVISVLWVIMVHTYLQMFSVGENVFTRVIVERSIFYQVVGNATFSVDTFFFISGLLVTLIFLKSKKRYPENLGKFLQQGGLEASMLVLYRYLRLTPAYLFAIFFDYYVLKTSSDSSVLRIISPPESCGNYWWRNILYINNFYPLKEICMMWSWYMANDMQFYIMAILLLFLGKRYFKLVALTLCSFLLSSWSIAGIISLSHHYTHKVARPFESFDFLYDKPWQRVGSYIMGMLTGYILYKVKTPPKISRNINCFLCLSSLGLLILIIFGVWQGELSQLKTAFYVSVGHTAFGFALVWIVLSCCWNLTPTVNRVLSYRGLWPLSRLTYCTYLIHPIIMRFVTFRMVGAVHLSNLFILTIFLGNAVVSFALAFFVSALFEAPIIRLLKIFFHKK